MGSDDFKFDSEKSQSIKESVLGTMKFDPFLGEKPSTGFGDEDKEALNSTLDPRRTPAIYKNKIPYVSDLFFNFAAIDGLDFRKIYPYSFTITEQKQEFTGPFKLASQAVVKKNVIIKEIFLPLPPSSFIMDIPSATQLTVTLNGVVEESNGAPLRTINISGSTGIVNKSSSIYNQANKPSDQAKSFLDKIGDYSIKTLQRGVGNTLGQAQNVYNAAGSAVQRVSRSLDAGDVNFYPLNEKDDKILNVTGFYWFHSLLRFFEYYLHLKKSKKGRNYRLGFNVYKDKQFFFVTLNNFRWQKSPGSIEYNYSINLTAWKKNTSAGSVTPVNIASSPVSSNPNLFDTVRNAISGARSTISNLKNLSYALNQDIYENYISILNQVNLLTKSLQGSFFSPLDFSSDLDSNKSGPLGLGDAVSEYIKTNWETVGPEINKISSNNYSFSSQSSSSSPLYDLENKSSKTNKTQKNILPNDLKKDPFKYSQVLDQIQLESLNLNEKSANAINTQIQKAKNLTVYDLIEYRKTIQSFSKTFSDSTTKDKILNTTDVFVSSQLNDVILALDQLINFLKNQPKNSSNDYYSYYIDYAVSNGLNLTKANSKFFVPFPTETTLESLALQYLGDSGRWMEIAAINGLKPPYVDETGFYTNLKANGSQSAILLSNKNNLYIGQVLVISSNTIPSKKIKVTDITEFSKTEYLITFEGNLDLSVYKAEDDAKVHGFLPNTVNSLMLIAIPSDSAPINQDQVNLGPGLDQLNSVAQLSKIDFMLTDLGDLFILPNGDIKKAEGLTNLSQAAKIKLFTAQGSMLHRPDFGNSLRPGISVSTFNAKEYLNQLNKMFGQDERFTGILLSNINVKGPAVDVNLLIGTSTSGVNLPITTTVPVINM